MSFGTTNASRCVIDDLAQSVSPCHVSGGCAEDREFGLRLAGQNKRQLVAHEAERDFKFPENRTNEVLMPLIPFICGEHLGKQKKESVCEGNQ